MIRVAAGNAAATLRESCWSRRYQGCHLFHALTAMHASDRCAASTFKCNQMLMRIKRQEQRKYFLLSLSLSLSLPLSWAHGTPSLRLKSLYHYQSPTLSYLWMRGMPVNSSAHMRSLQRRCSEAINHAKVSQQANWWILMEQLKLWRKRSNSLVTWLPILSNELTGLSMGTMFVNCLSKLPTSIIPFSW